MSLVEPMCLLDSVSDDCVIKSSKALSLFCVLVFAYVMTCVCLCWLVFYVFKAFVLILHSGWDICVSALLFLFVVIYLCVCRADWFSPDG